MPGTWNVFKTRADLSTATLILLPKVSQSGLVVRLLLLQLQLHALLMHLPLSTLSLDKVQQSSQFLLLARLLFVCPSAIFALSHYRMQTKRRREHSHSHRQRKRQTADMAHTSEIPQGSRPAQRAPTKSIIMLQNSSSRSKNKKIKRTHTLTVSCKLWAATPTCWQQAVRHVSKFIYYNCKMSGSVCVCECVCERGSSSTLSIYDIFFWLSQKRKWLEKPRLPLRCGASSKYWTVCVCADSV